MIQKSNFIHIFPWWGKSQWTFYPPLSASLTSWENYYLNGPGGLFLLHFLLLGMLKVGVFQHNGKYLIRLRTWSSLLCHFCKTEKRVWEKQRPTDCQKKKKKDLFFISKPQTICNTRSRSSPVIWQIFRNIFELTVLFSALYETINIVTAGTDFVVILENITILRSKSGEGNELGLQCVAMIEYHICCATKSWCNRDLIFLKKWFMLTRSVIYKFKGLCSKAVNTGILPPWSVLYIWSERWRKVWHLKIIKKKKPAMQKVLCLSAFIPPLQWIIIDVFNRY